MQVKNILLIGKCEYELIGLTNVLTELGHYVLRESEASSRYRPDITVIALSAEPLLGWGKNISFINDILSKTKKRVLIIAPGQYSKLTILRGRCSVLNGELSVEELRRRLSDVVEDNGRMISDYYSFTGFYSATIKALTMAETEKKGVSCSTYYYRKKRILKMFGLKNKHEFNLLSVGNMQGDFHGIYGDAPQDMNVSRAMRNSTTADFV